MSKGNKTLIRYKKYVTWCKSINVFPIGFVNWKAKRMGCVWDDKKGEYIKIINQQEYCNCPQGGLAKPISKTECECTNCGKEILNQKQ